MNVRIGLLAILLGWIMIVTVITIVVLWPVSIALIVGTIVAWPIGRVGLKVAEDRGWVDLS